MAIRKIVKEGDEILRKNCIDVTAFNEKLWTLLDDMRETMLDANGVGLAAPQMGLMRRIADILPRQTISFGDMVRTCSRRYSMHRSCSSGFGSLFFGGRHFNILAM